MLTRVVAIWAGLTSYSILHNPKYQRAFNINDDFTSKHKRVSSLKNILSPPSSPSLLRQPNLLTLTETEESDFDIEMQQPRVGCSATPLLDLVKRRSRN